MLLERSTAILLGALIALPATADAAMKVAVVDVQGAMEATKHWQSARQKLEKERTVRQAALEQKQKELRKRKDQLEAKKAVADPKSLLAEEEKLYQDAEALTQAFVQNQQALTALEKQATEQMLLRVEAVVRQIASKDDYAYVFETGPKLSPNVWYSKKGVDITKRVVKLYETAYKGKPLQFGNPRKMAP